MTKKKYLILFTVIMVLLVVTLIISNMQDKDSIGEVIKESFVDYKITEDTVILNTTQDEQESDDGIAQPKAMTFGGVDVKINKLTLFSSDFQNLELIPVQFTCDGDNINPNLEISGVDENAQSLVLIMDDPDAPNGTWDHWIKFNIPVDTKNINSGEELQGVSGKGTGGNLDYSGPCPPDGKHNYIFKLYTLDIELILSEGSSKTEVEEAMEGHILQQVELAGVYERKINLVEEKEESGEKTKE